MNRALKQQAYRFGLGAEKRAAWYLRLKGYRILAERLRNGGGEIDLVAARGKTLIAVEVKARKALADCSETVPPWKQQKIARAIEGFWAGLPAGQFDTIRFDVIWMAPDTWPQHIKDAWTL